MNMRLPLARHFCAEKWHFDLVRRSVLYLLPVFGESQDRRMYCSCSTSAASKTRAKRRSRFRG